MWNVKDLLLIMVVSGFTILGGCAPQQAAVFVAREITSNFVFDAIFNSTNHIPYDSAPVEQYIDVLNNGGNLGFDVVGEQKTQLAYLAQQQAIQQSSVPTLPQLNPLEISCEEKEEDEACIERYFKNNPEKYNEYQKYVADYNASVKNHLIDVQNRASNRVYDLTQAFDECSDKVNNNQLIAGNNQLDMQLNLYECVRELGFLKEVAIINTTY